MDYRNIYDIDKEIKNSLSRLKTARKQYEMFLPLKLMEEKILEDKFESEEIFSSNHIEGNSYTLAETRYLLNTKLAVNGKKIKDGQEILNMRKSIDLIKRYDGNITEEFIKKIHKTIVNGTLDYLENEGEYKNVRNYIGEVKTSSVEQTPIHMQKIVNWLNSKNLNDDLLNYVFEFKYLFLVIHPFVDGNGRTIRLLVNYLLIKYGFIPIVILPEYKEDYYNALDSSSKKNCKPIKLFMLNMLIVTYERRLSFLREE